MQKRTRPCAEYSLSTYPCHFSSRPLYIQPLKVIVLSALVVYYSTMGRKVPEQFFDKFHTVQRNSV